MHNEPYSPNKLTTHKPLLKITQIHKADVRMLLKRQSCEVSNGKTSMILKLGMLKPNKNYMQQRENQTNHGECSKFIAGTFQYQVSSYRTSYWESPPWIDEKNRTNIVEQKLTMEWNCQISHHLPHTNTNHGFWRLQKLAVSNHSFYGGKTSIWFSTIQPYRGRLSTANDYNCWPYFHRRYKRLANREKINSHTL